MGSRKGRGERIRTSSSALLCKYRDGYLCRSADCVGDFGVVVGAVEVKMVRKVPFTTFMLEGNKDNYREK